MLGGILLVVGGVLMLHAAFSTFEHLSHSRALGQPETALPLDIVLESLIGLVVGILGASLNAKPLKEITWASEMKSRKIEEMDARPGFARPVHRGNLIF